MTYGVLVQVSVHGTDNRLLVETLKAHPQRLRGIAVVAPDIGEAALRELNDSGVVGLRLNVLYGGGVGFDRLERYAAICRELGWHQQFLVDAKDLVALSPRLGRLQIPCVIDHVGHFPTSRGLNDPGFLALLSLVRDGAWVKLSGAYRNTTEGPPYADTVPFASAAHSAAPDRCVWGSDWPHVSHWGAMMKVADLLDLLADWVPGEEARHRVLCDNAHRLYGFPRASAPTS
jgi:predicted TIM-barrel fold metal-dependent hydrolase